MSIPQRVIGKLRRDGISSLVIAVVKYPYGFFRRNAYKKMLKRTNLVDRFSEIYAENFWHSKESGSGLGSEIEHTEPLREWLVEIIPKLEVGVFVDAPCGDFNWMRKVLPSLDVDYRGLDIVASVIESNQNDYSADNIHFEVADICKDPLPSCDLFMIRDCLIHLSYQDINKFLMNLSRLDYKYLLITTHIVDSNFKNANITSGDYRRIDLFSGPFNFDRSKVMDRVNDYPPGCPVWQEMILVEKRHVPKFINLND